VKILVCTDFSAPAAAGEREAAARFPGAEIVVFHAVDTRLVDVIEGLTTHGADELRKGMATSADVRLNEIVERLTSQGHQAIAELAEGDPVDTAMAAAERHGAVAIVAGVAPGVALGRFRTLLARRSTIAVLFVPEAR
jgi:hypothetical protein